MKYFGLLASSLLSRCSLAAVTDYEITAALSVSATEILNQHLDDSVNFLKVTSHGCWCARLDNRNDRTNLGGKDVTDDLDDICKSWMTARRCNDNLNGGSCQGEGNLKDRSYVITVDDDLSPPLFTCNSSLNSQECEADSCTIDNEFAGQIRQYLQDNPSWAENTSPVCSARQAPVVDPTGYDSRRCSGSAPYVTITEDAEVCPFENQIWSENKETCMDSTETCGTFGNCNTFYVKAELTNARTGDGSFWPGFGPELAIDGDFSDDSQFHSSSQDPATSGQEQLTLSIDLVHPCKVKNVYIYSREDESGDGTDQGLWRYTSLSVTLNGEHQCTTFAYHSPQYVVDHHTSGLRYICDSDNLASTISIMNAPSHDNFLQVREVEVICENTFTVEGNTPGCFCSSYSDYPYWSPVRQQCARDCAQSMITDGSYLSGWKQVDLDLSSKMLRVVVNANAQVYINFSIGETVPNNEDLDMDSVRIAIGENGNTQSFIQNGGGINAVTNSANMTLSGVQDKVFVFDWTSEDFKIYAEGDEQMKVVNWKSYMSVPELRSVAVTSRDYIAEWDIQTV